MPVHVAYRSSLHASRNSFLREVVQYDPLPPRLLTVGNNYLSMRALDDEPVANLVCRSNARVINLSAAGIVLVTRGENPPCRLRPDARSIVSGYGMHFHEYAPLPPLSPAPLPPCSLTTLYVLHRVTHDVFFFCV